MCVSERGHECVSEGMCECVCVCERGKGNVEEAWMCGC